MDHSFRTRRGQIERIDAGLALLSDAATVMEMTDSDRLLVKRRCDTEIQNGDVLKAVVRNAPHLGRLLRHVDDLLPDDQRLPEEVHTVWSEMLLEGVRSEWLVTLIAGLERTLGEERARISPDEVDDGSSSYSDYSADETEDSSDGDDGDDGDDDK